MYQKNQKFLEAYNQMINLEEKPNPFSFSHKENNLSHKQSNNIIKKGNLNRFNYLNKSFFVSQPINLFTQNKKAINVNNYTPTIYMENKLLWPINY